MKWKISLVVDFVCVLLIPKLNFSQVNTAGEIFSSRIYKTDTSRNPVKYLNESSWNHLFPHRYGHDLKDTVNHHPDFYSFKSFDSAAAMFPGFLSEGSEEIQKRELSAFLATIAYETGGGWDSAPGGYFTWGLLYIEEKPANGERFIYVDTTKNYPPFPGASYFGRGAFQLSWNYNYGQFSEAWYGNKDSLLEYPGLLSADPVLSFSSAIWFWMTAQYPKPSCHDIMVGNWVPVRRTVLQEDFRDLVLS